MKITLSRKGFDSDFGGFPSPIFPDGSMCSLPIPARDVPNPQAYSQIHFNGLNLGKIVSDLSKDKLPPNTSTHLDPDLREGAIKRCRGWLPAFGQVGPAQSHLSNQSVSIGDLFLFFGWFRDVVDNNGHWLYAPRTRGIHVLFGWLQIGSIINLSNNPDLKFSWALDHPHVAKPYKSWTNNTLYIASESLSITKSLKGISGGGVFPKYHDSLRLTDPESKNRSKWQLPGWFYPAKGKPPLSYHSNLANWKRRGKNVILSSVGRGQEFVLDADLYPEARGWLRSLFKHAP